MRTIKLSDLITEVRRRADVESVLDRFPDSEVTSYINASIARLYALMDRLDVSYYTTTAPTITTTAGTSLYALPVDFWILKAVTVRLSSSVNLRARKYSPEQGPWLKSTGNWVYGLPIYYRLKGKDPFSGSNKDDPNVKEYIDFAPIPGSAYGIDIEYTKAPQKLYSGDDAFDGQAGFEEWVILDAAIKIKRKQRLDCGDLMSDKAEMEAHVVSLGSNKDAANPECLVDLQSDVFYTWPYGS